MNFKKSIKGRDDLAWLTHTAAEAKQLSDCP